MSSLLSTLLFPVFDASRNSQYYTFRPTSVLLPNASTPTKKKNPMRMCVHALTRSEFQQPTARAARTAAAPVQCGQPPRNTGALRVVVVVGCRRRSARHCRWSAQQLQQSPATSASASSSYAQPSGEQWLCGRWRRRCRRSARHRQRLLGGDALRSRQPAPPGAVPSGAGARPEGGRPPAGVRLEFARHQNQSDGHTKARPAGAQGAGAGVLLAAGRGESAHESVLCGWRQLERRLYARWRLHCELEL